MSRPIVVRADWDPEAEVWVAESADLPALVTEADSIEALREKLRLLVPELMALEGGAPGGDIALEIIAYARERIDAPAAA